MASTLLSMCTPMLSTMASTPMGSIYIAEGLELMVGLHHLAPTYTPPRAHTMPTTGRGAAMGILAMVPMERPTHVKNILFIL